MKRGIVVALSVFGVLLLLLIVIIAVMVAFTHPRTYITTDIADYGQYVGNYDNETVQEFVSSFFPDNLEPTFSDIVYSYRAQKNDTYAFEVYLEFTIKDADEYQAFINRVTKGKTETQFLYDNTFIEYTIADVFRPVNQQASPIEDVGVKISFAEIGKILCSPGDQRIIFVALGVYDGGIATTNFLTVYFDRFEIDPLEYASRLEKDALS